VGRRVGGGAVGVSSRGRGCTFLSSLFCLPATKIETEDGYGESWVSFIATNTRLFVLLQGLLIKSEQQRKEKMRKSFGDFLENVVSLHHQRRTKVNKGNDDGATFFMLSSTNQLIKMNKHCSSHLLCVRTSGEIRP